MFRSSRYASTLWMAVAAFSLDAALAATTATSHQPSTPSTCALLDRAAADEMEVCRLRFRWPGLGPIANDGSGDLRCTQAAEVR